jgi:hypothetical protein
MGFDACQVDQMSVWQFNAQMLGWSKQYEEGSTKLSDAEADDLWEWLQAKTDVPVTRTLHERRKGHNGAQGPASGRPPI